jgi:type IV secretory pathway ATPase VirB11/archaellum biosynthesis ATPase
MDCFIKITPQKNTENKITIHKREFKILQEHIKSNTNVIICGNVGSGKTHFLDLSLMIGIVSR